MINNLKRDVEQCDSQTLDTQSLWVRQQNELVKLQRERESWSQMRNSKDLKIQVFDKTKIRLECSYTVRIIIDFSC